MLLIAHMRPDRIYRSGLTEPFTYQKFHPVRAAQMAAQAFTRLVGPRVTAAGAMSYDPAPTPASLPLSALGAAPGRRSAAFLGAPAPGRRTTFLGAPAPGLLARLKQFFTGRASVPAATTWNRSNPQYVAAPAPGTIRTQRGYALNYFRAQDAAQTILANAPGMLEVFGYLRPAQGMPARIGVSTVYTAAALANAAVSKVSQGIGIRAKETALQSFYGTRAGW